jgi:hypothetical protein
MPVDTQALRDWHRLFGLLLTDFFTGSPFAVEVEHDLSEQQQFLDVAIVRRRRGRFAGRLPDGMDDLADHNLFTFKSHREALDPWAIRELLGHAVAYRKLVSPSPSELLPEEHFRLYAVAARFPQSLAGQVPWHERQPGVYDCRWGLDVVRVIVARVSRTTLRCTCSARRRSWWALAGAPTGGARRRRAGCWASYPRAYKGRALPCRLRWRI